MRRISIDDILVAAADHHTHHFHDGNHGDGAANDGTYGQQIPTQTDGTMINFKVVATDNTRASSTNLGSVSCVIWSMCTRTQDTTRLYTIQTNLPVEGEEGLTRALQHGATMKRSLAIACLLPLALHALTLPSGDKETLRAQIFEEFMQKSVPKRVKPMEAPVPKTLKKPLLVASFAPFKPKVRYNWDGTTYFLESDNTHEGMPSRAGDSCLGGTTARES